MAQVLSCNITSYQYPVYYNGTFGGLINNTNASTTCVNCYAIFLTNTNYTTINNTIAISTVSDALHLENVSHFNNITGSTFNTSNTSGGYALSIYNSTGNVVWNNTLISTGGAASGELYLSSVTRNNTFYWNNFTNTSGYYVNDTNGTNYYNTTRSGVAQGNIWYNVMNGSVSIVSAKTFSHLAPRLLLRRLRLRLPLQQFKRAGQAPGQRDRLRPVHHANRAARTSPRRARRSISPATPQSPEPPAST